MTAISRDVKAQIRYFNANAPPEVRTNGVLTLGDLGDGAEMYKKRRHFTTEVHEVVVLEASRAAPGGDPKNFQLDTHGLCLIEPPLPMDFLDRKRVVLEYYPKLEELVRRTMGAERCFMNPIFGTRSENPENLGISYARFAHTDAGPEFRMLVTFPKNWTPASSARL